MHCILKNNDERDWTVNIYGCMCDHYGSHGDQLRNIFQSAKYFVFFCTLVFMQIVFVILNMVV